MPRRTFHEFNVRGCRQCKFSNGGNYFAAVAGNAVEIFHTYTLQSLGTLKGHNGRVQSVRWSKDDAKIVTAGVDGAVYEWDSRTLSRSGENVLKSNAYTCAVFSADSKTVYAVGSDKSLKEIAGGNIAKDLWSQNEHSAITVLTQVRAREEIWSELS